MPRWLISILLVFVAFAQVPGWLVAGWYIFLSDTTTTWVDGFAFAGFIVMALTILHGLVDWANRILVGGEQKRGDTS